MHRESDFVKGSFELAGPMRVQCNPPNVYERPVRGGWMQWRSPFIEWNVATLPIPGLAPALDGLRIAHVTDLHVRKTWHPRFEELARLLREKKPDLLLFTGDFVESKRNHLPAIPNLHRVLKSFEAPLGCFAILGNHDTHRLRPRLNGTIVRLMDEGRTLINVKPLQGDHQGNDGVIELIGIPGVNRRELTPAFLELVPPREATAPGTLRIVMSHFPDHVRKTRSLRADIILSGHTHGGQCCLPGGIPIIKHDKLPRRLSRGVHRIDDSWFIVSRGVGTTGVHLRAFCPPEVIELRLTRNA